MDNLKNTSLAYGFMWNRDRKTSPPQWWHFNSMQEAIGMTLVQGLRGIDIGSGCGYDTYLMAKNNPAVNIVSIDLSNGVYRTKQLTRDLPNVKVLRCSILDMPLKNGIFDFAYSYGVLHHTTNPQKGLSEIIRILKKGSPVYLYLYEDHSDNKLKYMAVRIIDKVRSVTTKMSPATLYMLSWIFSPLAFMVFTLPASILKKFKYTRHISNKMPFNFGKGFFSLRGNLYDRFSAPVEHRFGRQQLCAILSEGGLKKIGITRIKDRAGWVAWGYKS